MKYNISVKIDAVFQSIGREGIFRFSSDGIDEAIDIVKNLISEMLSFPEKDVNEEALKKKFLKEGFLENLYYGNKIYTVKWLNLGYKSDVGRVRDLDEDSIVIVTVETASGKKLSNISLFVLGDGVGGHTKGEVASYLGTKTVAEDLINTMLSISEKAEIEIEESIRNSIKKANKVIYDHVKLHPEYGGMATTLVAALIKNNKLFVGNVGDSRAYIINDGIRQITTDHSVVQEMVAAGKITKEEARNHAQKNIVTRVVGYFQDVNVDVFKEDIYKEDTIMLCCDGLSDMLRDEEIRDIIVTCKGFTKASDDLVRMANERGGRDNISVILSRSNDLPSKIKTQEIPIITKVVATRKKVLVPITIAIIAVILLLYFVLIPMLYSSPQPSAGAPNIISWSNNKTNNAPNLIISTNVGVKFNATAIQTIDTWNWSVDDVDQSNKFDNFSTSFGSAGTHIVNVSATNAHGTSSNVTWTVTVTAPPAPPSAPAIISWGNNKTNDASLSFNLNTSEGVMFNATANQTIDTWSWFVDDVNQSNNFDNLSTNFTSAGDHTVIVNATNDNGTSKTINWSLRVNLREVDFSNISALSNTTLPGTNSTYNLNLTNNGTATDTYTITVSNPNNASTAATNITSATLAAGASQIFALNVTNITGGIFFVNVTATSVNDSTKFGYINSTTKVNKTLH